MTKNATEIKVGDIININTGYRPLDDENCKVLDIKSGVGLFGDPMINFYIESYHGNHWTDFSPDNTVTMGTKKRLTLTNSLILS